MLRCPPLGTPPQDRRVNPTETNLRSRVPDFSYCTRGVILSSPVIGPCDLPCMSRPYRARLSLHHVPRALPRAGMSRPFRPETHAVFPLNKEPARSRNANRRPRTSTSSSLYVLIPSLLRIRDKEYQVIWGYL